jgi:hypothetical protein
MGEGAVNWLMLLVGVAAGTVSGVVGIDGYSGRRTDVVYKLSEWVIV